VIVLGLTGSIGMGKTTTAGLFREAGVPVHDADVEVGALYAKGGAAAGLVEAAFPGVTVDGAVDKARLSAALLDRPAELARLEAIVHPLVAARRAEFLGRARAQGAPVAVLDIPLLYEIGADAEADAVVVVSAPHHVQRERTLARPGMTGEKLELILARQIPDAEKRARADFVIDTSAGVESARQQVRRVLDEVTGPGWTSRRRP
jgi:dephospho-CoA kinase